MIAVVAAVAAGVVAAAVADVAHYSVAAQFGIVVSLVE